MVKSLLPSLAAILVFTGTSAPAGSGKIEFDAVDPALIQQRLEAVHYKPVERKDTLEQLFREVGCEGDHLSEQPVPRSKLPNVICTLAGEGPSTIVVGGHFDLAEVGSGAVDDWSGVSLLPSLYQSLKSRARRHTFVFAGFAAEEVGLRGSAEYVKRLGPVGVQHTSAMINLECLGLTPPKVWAHRADPKLLDGYARVAHSLQMEAVGSNVELVGDDDSHPFLNVRIPVLTIHSITQDTYKVLHSTRDNLRAIHPDDYYAAYRLAATYLAYLDATLE